MINTAFGRKPAFSVRDDFANKKLGEKLLRPTYQGGVIKEDMILFICILTAKLVLLVSNSNQQ
ncbi:MAG: hypothetical protein U5M51_01925 [Emticicia sp.]|nr:hypothetical protein [Emticicia sp.]